MGTWKKTLVLGLLLPATSTIGFIWLSVIALVHRDIGEGIAAPVLIRPCLVLSPALCAAGLATALLALRKSTSCPTFSDSLSSPVLPQAAFRHEM